MHSIKLLFSLFLVILSPLAVGDATLPLTPIVLPKAPAMFANAYLLVDANSNNILAEKNSDLLVEPASLTKIMTMYVIDNEIKAGKLKLDDQVLISEDAWKASGSRMFVQVNTRVSVSDLIHGIIIQSGNDASIALAEHIAGSEEAFADLMNSYAKILGMHNTHFLNVTGLPDPAHVTTANDMAILARAIVKDFPETYKIYSQREFFYNNIRQYNRNKLLARNPVVDGIKTGFTNAAGYCLVASGKSENMRLIAIVMGAKSDKERTDEANKLLSWGFRVFETNLVYQAGAPLQDAKIWMGAKSKIELGFKEDLYVTTLKGKFKKYISTVNIPALIKAPLKKGDIVGTYLIQDEHEHAILEQPIIALQDVPKGNIFQRGRDYVTLNVQSIFQRFS